VIKSFGKDHRVRESHCLNCHEPLSGAFAIDADAHPKPGDVSICIKCGHVMIFGRNLGLRNPTKSEIREVAGDRRIVDGVNMVGKIKR
jgi:hypothetical protein